MSARNLLNGKNIILTLFALLVYLSVSYLQAEDTQLARLLVPQPTPTPAVTESVEEDIIEEHEPEDTQSSSAAVEGVATERQSGQVTKVVDGDTIEVLLNGVKEKIRIIGLNTPETVDPRTGVQCFGREASNFAKQTLTGKQVQLEPDATQSERDRYQRLLRYVWMNDGTVDFGKLMIAEGYGNEYTYERPYKYQAAYKQAEQEARTLKKGLWADTAC